MFAIKGDFAFFLLVLQLWSARADYNCLCAYSVETPVLASPSANGKVLGYMYEFDCKPVYPGINKTGMQPIQFEHKVGYVTLDQTRQVQLCQGSVSGEDKVYTTTSTTTTTTSTTSSSTTTTTSTTTSAMPSSTVLSTTLKITHAPTHNATTATTSTSAPFTNSTTSVLTTNAPKASTGTISTTTQSTTKLSTTSTATITTTTPSKPTTTSTIKPSPTTTATTTTTTSTRPSSTKPPSSTTTTTTTTKPTTTSTTARTTLSTTTQRPLTCPSGWLKYHGSCYYFGTSQRVEWDNAASVCKKKQAHLAIIESQLEDQFLGMELKKRIDTHQDDSSDTGIWVGGSDRGTEGKWLWHDTYTGSDKSFGSYSNWNPGEPDTGDNEHEEDCMCLIGREGFQWQDYKCSEHMYYVCEIVLFPTIPLSPTSPQSPIKTSGMSTLSCSNGWVLFQDNCYLFALNNGNQEWEWAVDKCRKDHSYLVIVDSTDEQRFLESHLKNHLGTDDDDGVWMGGTDHDHEGTWVWKNTLTDLSTPMTSYSNWQSAQPHHNHDECLAMFKKDNFKWRDYRCRDNIKYVCEKPAKRQFQSLVG